MLAVLAMSFLSPNLDAILDVPELKGAVYGAVVTRPGGEVLYERTADLHVMPASNQKLISCAFALATFGPEYRPQPRSWKIEGPGRGRIQRRSFPHLRPALAGAQGLEA